MLVHRDHMTHTRTHARTHTQGQHNGNTMDIIQNVVTKSKWLYDSGGLQYLRL